MTDNEREKLNQIDPDKLPFWSILIFAFPSARREYRKLIDTLAELMS